MCLSRDGKLTFLSLVPHYRLAILKTVRGGLTLGQEAGAAERVTEMALPQASLWQDSQRTVFLLAARRGF